MKRPATRPTRRDKYNYSILQPKPDIQATTKKFSGWVLKPFLERGEEILQWGNRDHQIRLDSLDSLELAEVAGFCLFSAKWLKEKRVQKCVCVCVCKADEKTMPK